MALSFLGLPPELRLMVYRRLPDVPFEAPLTEVKGLHLLCKQVKAEIDFKIDERLNPYLDSLRATWAAEPALAPTILVRQPALSRIHLKLTMNTTVTEDHHIFNLTPLSHLHFCTLELEFVGGWVGYIVGHSDMEELWVKYKIVLPIVLPMIGDRFKVARVVRGLEYQFTARMESISKLKRLWPPRVGETFQTEDVAINGKQKVVWRRKIEAIKAAERDEKDVKSDIM